MEGVLPEYFRLLWQELIPYDSILKLLQPLTGNGS